MSRAVFVRFLFAFLVIGSFAVLGCTRKTAAPNSENPKAEKKRREVNLSIWASYISPETQEEFTKKTGIEIHVSNYVSNEDLLAKVQAGASGIDVCVPSDYMVDIMSKTGLLHALNLEQIPNRSGLDLAFLKQEFDPENRFSLPYAWSTAGLAINRELFKGTIRSWKDLFQNQELSGKISLLDDVREVMAAALKANGYSVNSTAAAELEKAKATLKEIQKRIKMYRSDSIDPLVNKEVAVAHAFSSDALKAAQKTKGKIVYVLPEEGGTRAIDNLVIPKTAKNLSEAHELINFLLSKEVNVVFVKTMFGGPVVTATRSLLPPELQTNAALFPPAEKLKKFEHLKDVGQATRDFDRIWTEIKAE
jgi:spermidine/putrescine transport system substrate-binding protein